MSFLLVVSLLSVIPLTTYVRSYGKVLIVSLFVLVVCVLVVSFAVPYDVEHPQRLSVRHIYHPDKNGKFHLSKILIRTAKLIYKLFIQFGAHINEVFRFEKMISLNLF